MKQLRNIKKRTLNNSFQSDSNHQSLSGSNELPGFQSAEFEAAGKPPVKISKPEKAELPDNLRRYALLVWRIFERVERENPQLLTELLKQDRLKKNQRE